MKKLIKQKEGVNLLEVNDNSIVLKEGYVRILVKEVGLCRTDLFVANGTIKVVEDIILGHEFSGIVKDSKSNLFKSGDKVAVNPLYDDKFMGLDFDGCLREYIDVPESQVVLNRKLSYKIGAYLEPVAASMAVLKCLSPKDKNLKGAIYGENRIAELTYIILKEKGYNVELISDVKESEYDYIVETMFNEEDLKKIIKSLKKEGLFIIKSRKKSLTGLIVSDLVSKELTLRAVNYYNFDKSMRWLEKNYKLIEHLLGDSYYIDEWEKAFKVASSEESKKIFINFN